MAVKDLLRMSCQLLNDFNLRLAVLIGQVWPRSVERRVATTLSEEQPLHSMVESLSAVFGATFSQLFLWGLDEAKDTLLPLKKKLHQL